MRRRKLTVCVTEICDLDSAAFLEDEVDLSFLMRKGSRKEGVLMTLALTVLFTVTVYRKLARVS